MAISGLKRALSGRSTALVRPFPRHPSPLPSPFLPVVTQVHHNDRSLLSTVPGSGVVRYVTFDRSCLSCSEWSHLGVVVLVALFSAVAASANSSILSDVAV